MEELVCKKEGQLSALETKVSRIDKELFNGGGIVKVMPVLCEQVSELRKDMNELSKSVGDLRIAISGFNRFMSEDSGRRLTWKSIAVWAGVFVAAAAFVFTVWTNSERKDDLWTLDKKMEWKQDKTSVSPTTRSITIDKDSL